MRAARGATTVLHVQAILGIEAELRQAIYLARMSATKQEKRADWVASLRDILDALYMATGMISGGRLLSERGRSMPQLAPSEAFVSELRESSLRYMRELGIPSLLAKHTKKRDFRAAIVRYVRQVHEPALDHDELRRDYRSVAELLHTGALLFPVIVAQDIATLASTLESRLGPGIFSKASDPDERARQFLIVAGVDSKVAWTFIKGAKSKQRSRAKQGTKSPAALK